MTENNKEMSSEFRQDTITKRKNLLRSDAVVGDDDNKIKPSLHQETYKKRSSTTSHSKDSCTDMTGTEVLPFIENTLHKNAKDREFLLNIEEELRKIVADESVEFHFFPEMSSYNRMLVHRVAAYFGFIHNVDQNGKRIVVTKQKGVTRMPDIKFNSLIKHSNYHDKYPLGRRNVQSFDESVANAAGRPYQRNFRPRFYTTSGGHNAELNREKRARSFEATDWYGRDFNAVGIPYQQQFGEGMSSNCSSTASSSAIPAQMQNVHLPFYPQTAPFIPLYGNEAGLLSPSSTSAYSEPVNQPTQPYQPTAIYYAYKSVSADNNGVMRLSEKEEDANENIHGGRQSQEPPPHQQQQSHPHIPSLFSIQPHVFPAPPQQQQNHQQYVYPPYYPFQPVFINAASTPPNQLNAAQLGYQNYYPFYQAPPHTIVQPHPLLEENATRHLAEQLDNVNINSELEQPQAGEVEKKTETEVVALDGVANSGQRMENGNSAHAAGAAANECAPDAMQQIVKSVQETTGDEEGIQNGPKPKKQN